MRRSMKSIGFSLMLAAAFCLQINVVTDVHAQGADKKREMLERKLRQLREKKRRLEDEARKKIEKSAPKQNQSIGAIIDRYEKLFQSCEGKTSSRCADVMYTLSKLYYDEARDNYIQAREDYAAAMDRWERNPSGPEPVNPIPDYSKPLKFYRMSVEQYPDFQKADEGYYQIGAIMMLQGDLDGSKDAFQVIVDKFPGSVRASAAHFRLAEFCFMDRDFTCALKHIEKIDKSQINIEVQEMAHYRKAEIYYNRAEFDKAAELFYQYIDKCDNGEFVKKDLREEALEYLAICFSDMPGGAQKALDFFAKVGKRPYQDYVMYTVGMKNYNHGQYDDAIKALRSALSNYPLYKDAPTAQQMLVAALVIKKRYDEANVERENLVDHYWEDSQWAKNNSSDKPAIEKAKEEVRRALAQIPIHYHAEAQKNKKKDLFQKALDRYTEYFSKFPDDKWKVYEFKYNVAEIYNMLGHYEEAAEAYDYVARQDLSTFPKYEMELDTMMLDQEEKERVLKEGGDKGVAISQEDAGYNAIAAYDNLRKKTQAKEGLSDSASYSTAATQKFLSYIQTFQQRFPNSKTAAEVLYLAANVHYGAKQYPAAITEFRKIVDRYPKSEFGPKSLRMLANSYASSGDYEMALGSYNKLLEKQEPKSKEYNEILDLAAGAIFKKATELKKQGDLPGAAQVYKTVQAQYPKSKVADRAWFEAATCYEEAKDLEQASLVFAELGDKFPKSDLREKAYVRSAENYQKLERYEDAAKIFEMAAEKVPNADYAIPSLSAASEAYQKVDLYGKAGQVNELVAKKYPQDKRTPQALYNAGLIYEKGKLFDDAIRAYTTLAEKYPENEYAAEGYYSIGYCYEKMDKNREMAAAFSRYAEKFPEDRSKQVMALVRAAEAFNKMDDLANAEKNALVAVEVYDKFKKKASIDIAAAARAFYVMGEIKQKKFDSIELTGRTEKQVQDRLKEKTKALEPVLEYYAKAIELGVGEWTLRATYMIGKSFFDMAHSFKNQSLFGSKDQQIASKIKIVSGLEKFYLKAQEKFHWVIETANRENLNNEWTEKAIDKFMEMAFRKGDLYEEIGRIFISAPVPPGLSPEEEEAYRQVLEEKQLEAIDASLPKYEEGLFAAAELGIAENEWLTKTKERVRYINPSSEALNAEVVQPQQVAESEGEAGGGHGFVDERLNRNLARIQEIVQMNIPLEEKLTQLRNIEADARREIRKEQEKLSELKEMKEKLAAGN